MATNTIFADTSGAATDFENGTTNGGSTTNSGANNLIENNASGGFGGPNTSETTTGQDPLLGNLSDNGGPTDTHALPKESPAVDAGDTVLNSDQRGRKRPADFNDVPNAAGGDGSDIGAFELQPSSFSVGDITFGEDQGNATFVVTRPADSEAANTVASVDYATQNGTATAGSDYAAANGTLTFGPGETSKTVTVPVNDDTTDESDETFFLNLSNAAGATITDGRGTATITDDDVPPPPVDRPACSDGRDNDRDGKRDLNDPGCSSRQDDSERDPAPGPEPVVCTIKGTKGDDVLRGTPGRDVICGLGGNDAIYGLGGNDLLKGGAGNDVLLGGTGRDTLLGQEGNDALLGGPGRDRLIGGPGNDKVRQ